MAGEAVEVPERPARTFQCAVDRWAGVGPYYAMFPIEFAFDVVNTYTKPGGRVLDPFAGRGSSIYAASASDRTGCGIEINPVGWVYSGAKLRPTTEGRVLARLKEVSRVATDIQPARAGLPLFFEWAYSGPVLQFLLAARSMLRWEISKVDRTLMAFILVYLHGKRSAALSNQMRDSKAMAPDYAVRWWMEREMRPPVLNPVHFLEKRIRWRYKTGKPELSGDVLLGDSAQVLALGRKRQALAQPFDLLFTSPPYCGVTNYHYDQWLRLWMLGHQAIPRSHGGRWQRKFESKADYKDLLTSVFAGAAARMRNDAVVVVRTDARKFTLATTIEALVSAFPNKELKEEQRPLEGQTQTALYGDRSEKPGEVDLVMIPK